MRRNYFFIVILVIAGLIMAACGTSETATVPPTDVPEEAAAEPEEAEAEETETPEISGPLTILCGMQEDWCQAAVQAFEAETGIETSMVRMSSGEALARLQAEKGAPSFDVWYGGPSLGPGAAVEDGLIEAYVPENSSFIPEVLKDPNGVWTGIYVGALGFCSNPEMLAELGAEAPTSWQDLLDPVYAGNIAIADQRTSGTAVTAGGTLVAIEGSEDDALTYLSDLDANIFQYTKSGSAPGRMASAGEVAVAIIFSHDCVKFQLETGVELTVTFPEEGTGYEIGQVSLIADANNPEAAKVFIEWALTAAAQELAAPVGSFQIPTNPDAQVPAEAVKLEDVVLAEGFTPKMVAEIRGGNFPERFGAEVRGGEAAPAE
ncbi:MAG: ABC transporter substrate-binding protein [Chloroflexota bacterium]|nr:ABC transporter substrate-binding protein [Chloroflexota bacterium]